MDVPPPVVTISAAYGAGGAFVGPRVAERLGVRFVDRAISASVAAKLAQQVEEVERWEDGIGSGLGHFVSSFAALAEIWAGLPAPAPVLHDESTYKEHVASVLRDFAAEGAVILGRGGQVVLRSCRHALHVRLDGPVERRIAQAADIRGIDEGAARRAQHRADTERQRYFHRLYGGDLADSRYYHLVVDTTAVPFASCVEIVVAAVEGRAELRRLDALVDSDSGSDSGLA